MTSNEPELETITADLKILNQKGLHARAAAKFVRTAEQFDAIVRVSKDESTVPGTSILGLMMLAASPGTVIQVAATGPEREAAMAALTDLVGGLFGED